MTKTGESALEEATVNFKKSMQEADNAFASMTERVRPEGKDVIKPMLDDLADRLTYVDSKDAARIAGLKASYDAGQKLLMSEINDIKRTY